MDEDQNVEAEIVGHYSVSEPTDDHSGGFSNAFEDALDKAQRAGRVKPGGKYKSTVTFSVDIEVTNPPWVGDYRVHINPQPRP